MTGFVLAVGLVGAWAATGTFLFESTEKRLVIYCAAGIRPALVPIARRYEEVRGVRVALQIGPSGGLETQLRLAERGDLFLPAVEDPYLSRLQDDGLVHEVLPIATQRLVLAVRDDVKPPDSIAELLDRDLAFAVCNGQAAAGWTTERALQPLGLWERVCGEATVMFPTVTELAAAVRNGRRLEAGIVWDTTAQQFGLSCQEVPELEGAQGVVSIGVLRASRRATAASEFARFVTSEESLNEFVRRGYDPF